MKPNKSPGLDGLTSELINSLWDDLKDLYIEMINQVFHNERLLESQREGLISLFKKKSKTPLFIKNLCPLKILNIDYKISISPPSARKKPVLPKLIDDEQVGLMPSLYIEENDMDI